MSPTKSTFLKVIAWFLAVATGLSAIAGIAASIYATETDMYTSDTTYYDTAWFQSTATNYWYRVVDSYEFGYVSNSLENSHNVGYRMEDLEGNILAEKELEGTSGTIITKDDFLRYETNSLTYETIDLEEPIPVLVTLYIAENMDLTDDFASSYLVYHIIEQNLDILPTITIASVLVCFLSIIFLVCAVGHQKGTDEIVPNIQDKIPLDLYLCIVAAILFVPFIGVMYAGNSSIRPTTFCILLVVYGLYGLSVLLACLLTFATRLKIGKWWRNTLVYMISTWFFGGTKRFVSTISSMKKLVLFWFIFTTLFVVNSYNGFIALLVSFVILLLLTRNVRQMIILQKGGEQLASGNLDFTIDTHKMSGLYEKHGTHLNSLSEATALAVDARMKSEHMKTELITNVSHDIKTPLTSIINYVDLLEKEELTPTSKEYLDIINRHAQRLKKLTNDIMEASKASTGNMPCTLVQTDLIELIHQAIAEYDERWKDKELQLILSLPPEELFCTMDGNLTWRVLNNILNNASNYAQPNSRIYVDIEKTSTEAILSVKNISKEPLNIPSDALMERFVRGDVSRSTEGSGLGLHIAKSLMELQHGSFIINIDGDLFKTTIALPLAK